jgi:hypothetical protein
MDGCRTTDFSAEVELDYAPLATDARRDTIGSTDVRVRVGDRCEVAWEAGPPKGRSSAGLAAAVRAPTSPAAKRLAVSAIKALKKPPPADATPRQPLLYSPDESDTPLPGACGYAIPSYEGEYAESCEPYVDVTVPHGRAEILRAAAADLNVTCAIAADAVGDQFGDQIRAVTMTGKVTHECRFVEPLHRHQISAELSPDAVSKVSKGSRVSVAGHRGFADCRAEAITCRFVVSLSTNPDDAGALELDIRKQPGAAVIDESLPHDTRHTAERVLADIVRAHFS